MIFRVLAPVTALLVLMFGFIYPDVRKQASTPSLTASRNIEAAVVSASAKILIVPNEKSPSPDKG